MYFVAFALSLTILYFAFLLSIIMLKTQAKTNELFAHGISYTLIIFPNIMLFHCVFVRVLTTPDKLPCVHIEIALRLSVWNAKCQCKIWTSWYGIFVVSAVTFVRLQATNHNWVAFQRKTFQNCVSFFFVCW